MIKLSIALRSVCLHGYAPINMGSFKEANQYDNENQCIYRQHHNKLTPIYRSKSPQV